MIEKAKLHELAHLRISYIDEEICGVNPKKLTLTHPSISTKFKDNFSHTHEQQTPNHDVLWIYVKLAI